MKEIRKADRLPDLEPPDDDMAGMPDAWDAGEFLWLFLGLAACLAGFLFIAGREIARLFLAAIG